MLKNRVIPVLLIQDKGLVKIIKFKNSSYVGDPINAIRIFNEKEVDELIVLDIDASKNNKEPDYDLISEFAGECFMPLCYGGGVKTLKQAQKIFSLGIEKICIQSSALEDIKFVKEMSRKFGSQSIVVSVDIKKNWTGKYCLYSSKDNKITKKSWSEQIDKSIKNGAGEIILNCVDRDGTLQGMDINLISNASQKIKVPFIAVGGVSSLNDIKLAIDNGANAVGAGAFFVYQGKHRAVLITYPKYSQLEELLS